MSEFKIHVTKKAREQIKALLPPPGSYLRVGAHGGGCSGFSYVIEHSGTKNETDLVVEQDGFTIIVDPKSSQLLNGLVIDFVSNFMKSGFEFINPVATKGCGCGKSFGV